MTPAGLTTATEPSYAVAQLGTPGQGVAGKEIELVAPQEESKGEESSEERQINASQHWINAPSQRPASAPSPLVADSSGPPLPYGERVQLVLAKQGGQKSGGSQSSSRPTFMPSNRGRGSGGRGSAGVPGSSRGSEMAALRPAQTLSVVPPPTLLGTSARSSTSRSSGNDGKSADDLEFVTTVATLPLEVALEHIEEFIVSIANGHDGAHSLMSRESGLVDLFALKAPHLLEGFYTILGPYTSTINFSDVAARGPYLRTESPPPASLSTVLDRLANLSNSTTTLLTRFDRFYVRDVLIQHWDSLTVPLIQKFFPEFAIGENLTPTDRSLLKSWLTRKCRANVPIMYLLMAVRFAAALVDSTQSSAGLFPNINARFPLYVLTRRTFQGFSIKFFQSSHPYDVHFTHVVWGTDARTLWNSLYEDIGDYLNDSSSAMG